METGHQVIRSYLEVGRFGSWNARDAMEAMT
jgi:hypothetical protein